MVLQFLSGAVIGGIAGKIFGGPQSETTVSTEYLSEVVNETLVNITMKNQTTTSSVVTNRQNITINVDGMVRCDRFDVVQNLDSSVKFISEVNQSLVEEMINELDKKLETTTEQDVEIKREFLSGLSGGDQDNVLSSVKSLLRNQVSKIVNLKNVNESISVIDVVQNQEITIAGNLVGKDCTFKQDSVVALQLEAVSDQLSRSIFDQTVSYDADLSTTQKVVKVNEGPDWMFFLFLALGAMMVFVLFISIGAGTGKVTKYVLIGLLILILVVALSIIIYRLVQGRFPWESPECVDKEEDCPPEEEVCAVCQ